MEISSSNPDSLAELGWAAHHAGRLNESLQSFNSAHNLSPDHLGALLGLGIVQTETGHPQDAVKTLQRLCVLRPNFGGSALALSSALERNNQLLDAKTQYLLALRRDWTLQDSEPSFEEGPTIPEKLPEMGFSVLKPVGIENKGPLIQVGLWTNSQGKPPSMSSVGFKCSGPFRAVGGMSGKILAEGGAGEKWMVKYTKKGIGIIPPNGKEISNLQYQVSFEPAGPDSAFLIQEAKGSGKGLKSVGLREFRGSLVLYPQSWRKGFYLLNKISLEEYLLGVLPSEMPHYWPLESLKAQAVIARSYAILRKDKVRAHLHSHFDICDSQHCQVYRGVRAEKDASTQAVRETAGQLLMHSGKLVYSYYHSTCGGIIQSADEVRGWGNLPYLKRQSDGPSAFVSASSPWEFTLWMKGLPPSNCNDPQLIPNSEFRWLRIIKAATLERKLRKFRVGKIKAIIPLRRSASGHVQELLVRGTRREAVINREHEIRYFIGGESLRSTLFVIETVKNPAGLVKEIWVYGGGWGHGIGLCQAGAAGLAKNAGKNYQEILEFYYPGSRVQ